MMEKAEIREEFLRKFLEHSQAILIGKHKIANKAHKRLQALYNNVKKEGSLEIFSGFLTHENEGVHQKVWGRLFFILLI